MPLKVALLFDIGGKGDTDPLYKPFQELIALVGKMASDPAGTGVCSFYLKEGNVPVTKIVYWQTVGLYGTSWRLATACAKDNIEK